MEKTYSLSQLNELEIGLGERIRYLLYQNLDYPSFLTETGDLLERLWGKGIRIMEITIDEGEAAGLTLHGALKYRNKKYGSGLEFHKVLQAFLNGYNGSVPPKETAQLIAHRLWSDADQNKKKAS